ncbi:MAG: outer membrane protein assembly factor BamB [Verrucomicrobiales bacterium]|jgi:outer membrane protein assembly factor BamB
MNKRIHLLTLTALLATAHLTPATGEDEVSWPGWLGPKRDGRVDHFNVPTEWPEKLKKVWTAEVGTGYSTPIVASGRIYQHARQGDEDVVLCLDLETGKSLWRKTYEVYFTPGQGGTRHGRGPKSSPVFADGRLFTLSITGVLSAWDGKSGDLLWRNDFKKRFSENHPYWGVSTSPVVDAGQVVLQIGNDKVGSLLALDVTTGDEVWSHGKAATSYSSPIVVMIEGIRQIVLWNQPGLVSVESGTGRLLWKYSFPQVGNNQNTTTPLLHNGRLILGGENRGIRSVEPQLKEGVWTVKENWRQEEVALDMSTGVINGDRFFGFSHYRSGQFFCLDTETGKVLWKGNGRAGENVAFLSVPGYVMALVNDGELQILNATGDRHEKVQSYRVAEKFDYATWTAPVLLQDTLLVREKEFLKRLSLK